MSEPAGRPGIPARWTSSAKQAVGTSLGPSSRVWFTLSHGIVNEVYHPRIDTACVRDMELLLSSDEGMFLEEKRDGRSHVSWFAEGVPGFEVVNELPRGVTVHKEVLTDPSSDVLLQRVRITGLPRQARVTALLAPHLDNRGDDNVGWVGEFKGIPMLYARGGDTCLALAADVELSARSVGYVGFSDGWQQVRTEGKLSTDQSEAGPGNIALAAEISVGDGRPFTLAVGFGATAAEAALRARGSLDRGIDAARAAYVAQWSAWQSACGESKPEAIAGRTVLKVHESLSFPGASIASLSIPWGFAKGDDDLGGYHLVWPRDLVETCGGLLAAGAHEDAVRGLEYLRSVQERDGHWAQNLWLDGTPYWSGVQMDETALPVLLLGLLRQNGCSLPLERYWPMVLGAASFLIANGPVTGQDRWEEDAGYSPFTVAAEIAALAVAADIADELGHASEAGFFLEVADCWNAAVERWMFVTDTPLSHQMGVEGYYVRIAPVEEAEGASPLQGWVPIKNRPPAESSAPAAAIVSPDALALVRFGLRRPDDPRIEATVQVIDHVLRCELPQGAAWYRYTGDGYGEHDDGSPFDGTGVGRPWPLLAGERGHYELAAGRLNDARRLHQTLMAFGGENGLLPEQVWDGPDLPERELTTGSPTGSAMPLCWAHAESLKLGASLSSGRVFDTPRETVRRYIDSDSPPKIAIWARHHRIKEMPVGLELRVHLPAEGIVHWSADDWSTVHDIETRPGPGVAFATIPASGLPAGSVIRFTTRTGDAPDEHWEGVDHAVSVVG